MRLSKLLGSMALVLSFSSSATEVLVWDAKPLDIDFKVGVERVITFPSNVSIGLPQYLVGKVQVESAAGVVYFTPVQEFEETRMAFLLPETGRHIFVKVSADAGANLEMPDEDVLIRLKSEVDKDVIAENERVVTSPKVTFSELFQYAAKDWYAPLRLKSHHMGVVEKSVQGQYFLFPFWTGASAGLFDMKPVREYVTADYTLTAVMLSNRTSGKVTIDYSDVYPTVKAVTSQHLWLGPKGTDQGVTMLYVLSEGQSFLKSGVYAL